MQDAGRFSVPSRRLLAVWPTGRGGPKRIQRTCCGLHVVWLSANELFRPSL